MALKGFADKNTKDSGMEIPGIYKFKDTKMVPDPFLKNSFTSISNYTIENPAIVIDNGKSVQLTGTIFIFRRIPSLITKPPPPM